MSFIAESVGPIDPSLEDDFGDFENFSDFQTAESDEKPSNNLNDIILNTFEKREQIFSEEISLQTDLFLDKSSSSYKIWSSLKNLDQASSLKLIWKSSKSFQILLKSLKIDLLNIPNNNCIPIFASGLGLLEPIKSMHFNSENTKNTKSDDQESNKVFNSDETNNTNVMPDVNFDWNSSDLTNLLKEVQPNSNLLDLNYFATSSNSNSNIDNSNDNNNKTMTKISELESEILDSENKFPKPISVVSSPLNDPFHQLISQIQQSSTGSLSLRSNNLSNEANQILDELPILSFMRSNVLMFPSNDLSQK